MSTLIHQAIKLAGLRGRPCPICERIVTAGVVYKSPSKRWDWLNGQGMCERCSKRLDVLSEVRCAGWIDERMKEIRKAPKKCHIMRESGACIACARHPVRVLVVDRLAKAFEPSSCAYCMSKGRGVMPLSVLARYDDLELVACDRCGDAYALTGWGSDIEMMAKRAREMSRRWQLFRIDEEAAVGRLRG